MEIYYTMNREIVGVWEYSTLDGWVGIRQSDGRLDEVPWYLILPVNP